MSNFLNIEVFNENGLIIEVKDKSDRDWNKYNNEENSIVICFKGKYIFNRKPEDTIEPHMTSIFNRAIENNISTFIFDCKNLDLLTTTGIRIIIKWIKRIDNYNKENKKYKIKIYANKMVEWQELTFTSMKEIFPDLIELYKA